MAVGPRVLEATGLPRPGSRLSRLREWWEQEHVFGYGLIVPALVLLVTLVAFPFGMAIYFSLSDYWVGSPGGFSCGSIPLASICPFLNGPGGYGAV